MINFSLEEKSLIYDSICTRIMFVNNLTEGLEKSMKNPDENTLTLIQLYEKEKQNLSDIRDKMRDHNW